MDNNIITAIATPPGTGGIAIIRLSGAGAWSIIAKIFEPKNKIDYSTVKGYTLHYGHIRYKGVLYDEVLVALMRENQSYTGEETAEIQCHGGRLVAGKILELLLSLGAVHAGKGEFTKRAFLSGRIDLSRAEAVMETINATTEKDLAFSLKRLEGEKGVIFRDIRQRLLKLIAYSEAAVDFPEDGLDDSLSEQVVTLAEEIIPLLEKEITKAEQGRIYKEGLRTAIVGQTNVGKSSLLNALLNEERAIVTPIPGTTRDTVTEHIRLKGIPLNIVDTAGIRKTENEVEAIGVEKSRKEAAEADLVLFVFDGSVGITDEDKEIWNIVKDKKCIVIANKEDLGFKRDFADYEKFFAPHLCLGISAQSRLNLDTVGNTVEKMFLSGAVEISPDEWVGNLRHKESFLCAKGHLEEAISAAKNGMPLDFQIIDLYGALNAFKEIDGEDFSEEILDKIFSEFCIGK